jgi:hypothetical protein
MRYDAMQSVKSVDVVRFDGMNVIGFEKRNFTIGDVGT